MNVNHVIERGVRDALKAHFKYGHPRVSRGPVDRGGFYSAIDIGNPMVGKKTVPYTLISTGDAESIVPGLANYRMDLMVSFMSRAPDNTLEEHEAWADALGDWLDTEAWVEYLETNALALIYQPMISSGASLEVSEDGHWATNWMYSIVVCPLV